MNEFTPAADIMKPGTLFYRVFRDSPVGMVILNAADGVYVDLNDAFARLIGYSREELVGLPLTTVGLDLAVDRELILDLLRRTPRLADMPFTLTSHGGQVRTCIASVQLEEIDGHEYFFAIVQDVTEQEQVQRALQHSESRFRLFFRSLPLPLLVIDEVTIRILDVNPAACQLYGYTRDEFLGMSLNDLIPPGGLFSGLTSGRPARPAGNRSAITRQMLKDGTVIEVNVTSFSFVLEGRRVNLSIIEDVTERHAMQAALEASEEHLRIIADMTADAMWDYNLLTGEVVWSAGFAALFGYGEDVGKTHEWWAQHIHPEDRPAIESSIAAVLASSDDYWTGEYRFLRHDGRYANVLDNGYIVRDKDGHALRFMGTMIDLTEQLEVAEVTARVALEERQRLAHTLHDSVSQSLYSVSLLAEATRRRSESGDQNTQTEYIERLSELTVQALRQMRLLVYELRPAMLEQEGLAGALRHRLEAVEHRAGIKARLIDDSRGPIPAHLQGELFWIGQEALNNSLRHAAASAVTVRLRTDGSDIILEISDDGKGFNHNQADATGGLVAIRRHVANLAGQLTVNTLPGTGTNLIVRVPLGSGSDIDKGQYTVT